MKALEVASESYFPDYLVRGIGLGGSGHSVLCLMVLLFFLKKGEEIVMVGCVD